MNQRNNSIKFDDCLNTCGYSLNYFVLLLIFGIVNANMPLAMSNAAGTNHVYLQKLFNANPTIFEPVMLPSLPVIIDMEMAVALNWTMKNVWDDTQEIK